MRFYLDEVDGWHTRIAFVFGCEAVGDALNEMVGTKFLCIDIDIAENAVRAKVIKTAYVVVMLVGYQHSIKRLEVYAQHLLTEVGTAIYEDVFSAHFH